MSAYIAKAVLSTVQFTAVPTNGTVPLTVQFTSPSVDSDGNGIVHWNWDFGDGSTSNAQNPSHTYTTYGTFSPSLFVTNDDGVAIQGTGPSIAVSPGGIGFDDLLSSAAEGWGIPDGYAGLTWSNLYILNGIGFEQSNPSGYAAGSVSVSNVVFNGDGNAASITSGLAFNFISAYPTAAWNDSLQLEVLGLPGSTMTYSNIYTLSATSPTLINFNYFGVDEIYFGPFWWHTPRRIQL